MVAWGEIAAYVVGALVGEHTEPIVEPRSRDDGVVLAGAATGEEAGLIIGAGSQGERHGTRHSAPPAAAAGHHATARASGARYLSGVVCGFKHLRSD